MANEKDLFQVISDSPIFVPDPPEGVEIPRLSPVESMKAKAARFNLLDQRIRFLDKSDFTKLDVIRFEIARGLFLLDSEKLYVVGGYNSVSDYGKAALGFNSSMTSSYVRIARRFIKRNWPESIFSSVTNPNVGMEDFGVSQLIIMLGLSDDDIKALMSDGRLTYTTSVPKIKALIKEHKAEKVNREKALIEASYQTMDAAHEEFHAAYNKLKMYLLDRDDVYAANTLLPRIMDQVVIIYQEGRGR